MAQPGEDLDHRGRRHVCQVSGAYVYCSELKSGAVLFDGHIATNAITMITWSGADIVCDWYNLA